MSEIFQPATFGDLQLRNRVIMAPLTRSRSGNTRTPNALMRDYYVQRASAGLILTEATSVSPAGVGYEDTPGIWSKEQVAGWREITDAVHAAGGTIVLQLWHVGRISDPSLLEGNLPVAPSAIAPLGNVSLLRPTRPFVTPRALTLEEIATTIEDYRKGAENAKAAGFDGVEIHGANGYLPDQFLQSGSNSRTDIYGGSVENRARFLLDVTDAAISVWGSSRVGVHLSPRGDSNHIFDANPKETFSYVAMQLKKRNVAFIFIRESQGDGYLTPTLKQLFGGAVIANEGIGLELGTQLLQKGTADAISFGKLYISNPDLVQRLQKNAPLQAFNPSTLYARGAEGYVDYPSLV